MFNLVNCIIVLVLSKYKILIFLCLTIAATRNRSKENDSEVDDDDRDPTYTPNNTSPKTKVKPIETSKVTVKRKQNPRRKKEEWQAALRARAVPPEIASKIIKFPFRVGSDIKHATLNGYIFFPGQQWAPNTAYWRCALAPQKCVCSLIENLDDGTYKRGRENLGWAADGLTHLSHPPDFKELVLFI